MTARSALRRLARIEVRLRAQNLGNYTIMSDGGVTFWDSMHGGTITEQEIEALRQRGFQIVLREYPLHYLTGETGV